MPRLGCRRRGCGTGPSRGRERYYGDISRLDASDSDEDVSRFQGDDASGVSAGSPGPYSSFDPDDSSADEDLPRGLGHRERPRRGLGGSYRPPPPLKPARPQWRRDRIPGHGLEPRRAPGEGLEPGTRPGHGLEPRTQFRRHGLGSGHAANARKALLHYNASINRGIYGSDIARYATDEHVEGDPVDRGLLAVARFSRSRR
jgi:hypothetical protein